LDIARHRIPDITLTEDETYVLDIGISAGMLAVLEFLSGDVPEDVADVLSLIDGVDQ
jgi:hypothetical protein